MKDIALQESVRSRPTVRCIAKLAGVSAMTVSLALRNHPRISATTRLRVQAAAEQLSYCPDPNIAKLMNHLRVKRRPGFQAAIGAITTVSEGAEEPYLLEIMASARERAAELGYGFGIFRATDAVNSLPSLQRVLRNRGVEGLLLLPLRTPRTLGEVQDWGEFSVVSATYGVLSPQFHRVVPDQFSNAMQICRRLALQGYRRMGLVLSAEQDLRVHHGFSAATAWQSLLGGTEFIRPLIHDNATSDTPQLMRWFKRQHPDVIIAAGDKQCRELARRLRLRLPNKIGFVSANKSGDSIFAGIDEQPWEIGVTAIDQLAAMIQRGEKGTPLSPKVTMIEGRWIDGVTTEQADHARSPVESE